MNCICPEEHHTVAVRVIAPHDRNGNPRRGWLVVHPSAQVFVSEGYAGLGALMSYIGATSPDNLRERVQITPPMKVTASEFARLERN